MSRKFKLITFESWVTKNRWYDYADENGSCVPYLLVDRSPCSDPFFDPYAQSAQRRPLISGLCRAIKNFNVGDTYIYITRVGKKALKNRNIIASDGMLYYFGVAALTVLRVYQSHMDAAKNFKTRRYVVEPQITAYPPNLAHEAKLPFPKAAVSRVSCVVAKKSPYFSTEERWCEDCNDYYLRQRNKSLRAAECKIEKIDGLEAFNINYETAPIITPEDWGNKQMNTMGIHLKDEGVALAIIRKIAESIGGNN